MVPPGFFIKLPAIRSAPCPAIGNFILSLKGSKYGEYATYHHWRFNAFHKFTIAIIYHHQAIRIQYLRLQIPVDKSKVKILRVQKWYDKLKSTEVKQ